MIVSEQLSPSGRDQLADRLATVRAQVVGCAEKSGRQPRDITLIAVSKTHPVETVRVALAAGVTDLGENRVQEAESKIGEIGSGVVRWHLIGPLQANKARRAVKLFDVIHTVDSIDLAQRLERLCGEEDRQELPVLIQVSLANEGSKSGVAEAELDALVQAVRPCERIRLIGLMTLPPFDDDPEATRPYFRRLRELRDGLAATGAFGGSVGELSMGMSHDFPVAIEEGATMIRVGTAIFGERSIVG
jgi:pyridoxal phosphate enzyme (YggS family)